MSSPQDQLLAAVKAQPVWLWPSIPVFLFLAYFLVPYFGAHAALQKYNGPFSAKFTRLYLARASRNGVRSMKVHEEHMKHGKFVRIGPNEVSFHSSQRSSSR